LYYDKSTFAFKKGVKPVFLIARPVPVGVKRSVEEEIYRLLNLSARNKMDFQKTANPVPNSGS